MSTATTVPVTITPEAAGHVNGLGLERELAQILDYIQKTAPDLLRIEAVLDYDRDSPVPDAELVRAYLPEPYGPIDLQWQHEFDRWILTTYPVAISMHFVVTTRYEAPHGR
jgi:hypothetical protein